MIVYPTKMRWYERKRNYFCLMIEDRCGERGKRDLGLNRNIVFPFPKMAKRQNGKMAPARSGWAWPMIHQNWNTHLVLASLLPPLLPFVLLFVSYVLCIMYYVCLFLYINSSSLFAVPLNFILHTSSFIYLIDTSRVSFTVIVGAPHRQIQISWSQHPDSAWRRWDPRSS